MFTRIRIWFHDRLRRQLDDEKKNSKRFHSNPDIITSSPLAFRPSEELPKTMSFSTSSGHPFIEGQLSKKSKFGTWRTVKATLVLDTFQLFLYKGYHDTKPYKELYLHPFSVLLDQEKKRKNQSKTHNYIFVLRSRKKKWKFKAPNKETCNKWCEYIDQTIKNCENAPYLAMVAPVRGKDTPGFKRARAASISQK